MFKYLNGQSYEKCKEILKILDYGYFQGYEEDELKELQKYWFNILFLKLAVGFRSAHFVTCCVIISPLIFKYTSLFVELLKEREHSQPKSIWKNKWLSSRLRKEKSWNFHFKTHPKSLNTYPHGSCANLVIEKKRPILNGSSYINDEGAAPRSWANNAKAIQVHCLWSGQSLALRSSLEHPFIKWLITVAFPKRVRGAHQSILFLSLKSLLFVFSRGIHYSGSLFCLCVFQRLSWTCVCFRWLRW